MEHSAAGLALGGADTCPLALLKTLSTISWSFLISVGVTLPPFRCHSKALGTNRIPCCLLSLLELERERPTITLSQKPPGKLQSVHPLRCAMKQALLTAGLWQGSPLRM